MDYLSLRKFWNFLKKPWDLMFLVMESPGKTNNKKNLFSSLQATHSQPKSYGLVWCQQPEKNWSLNQRM